MASVSAKPDALSPDWWLLRLTKKLFDRNRVIGQYDRYYEGHHRIAFLTPKFRQAFGNTFEGFSDNWCKIIADAPDERLSVEGFRYGDDLTGDKKAWKLWQQNELDSMSQMAHLEAIINCESYALVWPDENDVSFPRITIEHPTECIVEYQTGSRRIRAAALKCWVNDDGHFWATLYLPDGLYKYKSATKADSQTGTELHWQTREVSNEEWPLANPFGVVPVVPLANDPRLLKGGVSELADVLPVQDAINKTIADLLVTSEFTAAPQRYAIGWPIQKDDKGKPVNPVMDQLLNRMLIAPAGTEFGQFPQSDLSNFKATVEMFVQHLASRTRTPPHYFNLNGSLPSGEAIKSAETGLVAKVKRKAKHFGEGWEEVMRLAFVVVGDKRRSQEHAAETVWADPETRSESEHIDAIGKKRALLHIPIEQAWADAGYSPQQIERMKAQLVEEKEWLDPLQLGNTASKSTQIAGGAKPFDPSDPNQPDASGGVVPA